MPKQLTDLTLGAPATGDQLIFRDVSDLTDGAGGTDKRSALESVRDGNIVADKAAAVALLDALATAGLLTASNGRKISIASADGGDFYIRTGAALATYADDGGSFCGTQFIPTGGDGSAGLVRKYDGRKLDVFYGATPGAADSYTNLQTALTSLSAGDTFVFTGDHTVSQGLTVSAHDITVTSLSTGYFTPKITCITTASTVLTMANYGSKIRFIAIEGDATGPYGENATITGISFIRADASKDIDGEVADCTISKCATDIYAKGANLIIKENLFSTSINGVVVVQNATDECRGFRVERNRFHSLGGPSTDATVAASKCINITANGFYNTVKGNFADGVKTFFYGSNDRSDISDNSIGFGRGEVLYVTNGEDGTINDNRIDNNISSLTGISLTGSGIRLNGSYMEVSNNKILGVREHGIYVESGLYNSIIGNNIHNCNRHAATDGYIYDGVSIASGANTNHISSNTIRQSIGGIGCRYGINDGASGNTYGDNLIVSVTTPYNIASSSTFGNLPSPFGAVITSCVTNGVDVDSDNTLTVGTSDTTQRISTGTMTADRSCTLSNTGVYDGARFKIVRVAGGAFNYNIIRPDLSVIKALTTNTWAEFEYSTGAGAWVLTAYGAL